MFIAIRYKYGTFGINRSAINTDRDDVIGVLRWYTSRMNLIATDNLVVLNRIRYFRIGLHVVRYLHLANYISFLCSSYLHVGEIKKVVWTCNVLHVVQISGVCLSLSLPCDPVATCSTSSAAVDWLRHWLNASMRRLEMSRHECWDCNDSYRETR